MNADALVAAVGKSARHDARPGSQRPGRALRAGTDHPFGTRHAVAASGTAALHCALAACGIGPGDEVLLPALSVIMSAAPITYAGATPVFFYDCAPGGNAADYQDLSAKLTPRAKAIMPVYLWGRAADAAQLADFAAEHELKVIKDACQAHGTRSDGRLAGTSGDAGCFSTKDGKLLWSGEGGFILTDDPGIAARCQAFRTHWRVLYNRVLPPVIDHTHIEYQVDHFHQWGTSWPRG